MPQVQTGPKPSTAPTPGAPATLPAKPAPVVQDFDLKRAKLPSPLSTGRSMRALTALKGKVARIVMRDAAGNIYVQHSLVRETKADSSRMKINPDAKRVYLGEHIDIGADERQAMLKKYEEPVDPAKPYALGRPLASDPTDPRYQSELKIKAQIMAMEPKSLAQSYYETEVLHRPLTRNPDDPHYQQDKEIFKLISSYKGNHVSLMRIDRDGNSIRTMGGPTAQGGAASKRKNFEIISVSEYTPVVPKFNSNTQFTVVQLSPEKAKFSSSPWVVQWGPKANPEMFKFNVPWKPAQSAIKGVKLHPPGAFNEKPSGKLVNGVRFDVTYANGDVRQGYFVLDAQGIPTRGKFRTDRQGYGGSSTVTNADRERLQELMVGPASPIVPTANPSSAPIPGVKFAPKVNANPNAVPVPAGPRTTSGAASTSPGTTPSATPITYTNPILKDKIPEVALAYETYRIAEALSSITADHPAGDPTGNPTLTSTEQMEILKGLTTGSGSPQAVEARLDSAFKGMSGVRLKALQESRNQLLGNYRQLVAGVKRVELATKSGAAVPAKTIRDSLGKNTKSLTAEFLQQRFGDILVDGASPAFQSAIKELGSTYLRDVSPGETNPVLDGFGQWSKKQGAKP